MTETNENKTEIKKSNIVYYARMMPTVGLYEVVELKVRTVADDFFVGIDKNTKHAYMFKISDINKIVFFDRKDAVDVVKAAEKKGKKVSDEKYYEEY